MKKKIILVLLLIISFSFNPVMAEEKYDSVVDEKEVLEPASTEDYDIHNDVKLEGGGTYFWYEIWGFRAIVVFIVAGGSFLIYKLVRNKKGFIEGDF